MPAIGNATNNSSRRQVRLVSRLGFVACLVLLIPFGTWMGVQASRPYAKAAVLCAQNDAEERKYLQLRLQNQQMEIKIRSLETRAGVINAARPLGWVLPGERRLHVPQP